MDKKIDFYNILPASAGINMAPGQIALANESTFAGNFLSEPLTQYAVGWRSDQNLLENLLEFLAPMVPVARRFEYRKANNEKAYSIVEENGDIRALYGDFGLVKADGTVEQAKTACKGLRTIVDRDTLPADPMAIEKRVAYLKKILLRLEIRRATNALAEAATNVAKTWDANGTPDIDVTVELDAAGNDSGINPNRVLYGTTAWQKRLTALGSTNKTEGRANFGMDPAALARFFAVDQVRISNERYQAAKGAKSKLTPTSCVFLFAAEKGASTEDASNVKRFVSTEAGGDWQVYQHDLSAKLIDLTV